MVIIWLAIAYLLGAIPFGYLIARLQNIDIRRFGSGNIGATNVFRTLGPVPGIIVFGLDLLKGTLATHLVMQATPNPWLIIGGGALAVVGHSFPIFLNFKGGRGAATALGVVLAIAPDIFLAAAIVAATIIYITKYVSLGSMTTAVFVTGTLIYFQRPLPYSLVSALITALIIYRHIPNIKRLRAGTERKIGEQVDV
ncbi:MAG: glycerol-3-phosphate 1-O-acyltransferase PlsY [bacterium]